MMSFSNDNKVDDVVTLAKTFLLKLAISDFVVAVFNKHILLILEISFLLSFLYWRRLRIRVIEVSRIRQNILSLVLDKGRYISPLNDRDPALISTSLSF